jgi:YidC/Oxa1 family membrane protein insertase
MKKMQALQPEIKAIQDRYGKLKTTDPARQKMNQELMDLYKQRGVNPAGGCVPMLLTMPILFAFYSMLAYSIELRGAPFGLWIKDLSVYDPYFVSPILTGITMVVQQKMTPQTATDPVQQKMFMFMPVIFTVMFLWAPSGLNIYWLVNNLLAIGQQYFTNRLIGPARTPRPVAERRLTKKGDGTV